jgi:hypothetical protein
MIKVIDDFLPVGYYKEIEKLMLGPNFPWFYLPNICDGGMPEEESVDRIPGFYNLIVHQGTKNSDLADFFMAFALTVQELLENTEITRIRADMVLPGGINKQDVHVDSIQPHIASVLYIGESDGDTILYKEKLINPDPYKKPNPPEKLTELKRISPKPNRLVLFNGNYWHVGETPSRGRRIVLNSNYYERRD